MPSGRSARAQPRELAHPGSTRWRSHQAQAAPASASVLSAPISSSARSSQLGRVEAEVLQQVELLAARVVQHPLVPAVVDRLPAAAQAARAAPGSRRRSRRRPGRAPARGAAAPMRSGATAAVGSARTQPRPVLPVLGPGMGVALAHDVVAVDRLGVRALVAGDDARRHADRAHHDDEGGGEVLAEALLAVEPELVDASVAVLAVVARRQRVGEAAGADVAQHRPASSASRRRRGRRGSARSAAAQAQRCADWSRAAAARLVAQARHRFARAVVRSARIGLAPGSAAARRPAGR